MVAIVVSVNAPEVSFFALNKLPFMYISALILYNAFPFLSVIFPVIVTLFLYFTVLMEFAVIIMFCFFTLNVVLV